MSPSSERNREIPEGRENPENLATKRELIVIASPVIELRASAAGIRSEAGRNIDSLADVLASQGAVMHPLFGESEEQIQAEAAAMSAELEAEVPDLSMYYQVEAPDDKLEELAERLRELEGVEGAYVKPPAEPARIRERDAPQVRDAPSGRMVVEEELAPPLRLNDMEPAIEEAPAVTPDFTPRQEYLNPAPTGIDAQYAWTLPGGRGWNVRVIDIEWGWRFSHEDLVVNQGGVVAGTNSTSQEHGTAVLGEISGDVNAYGITGISPDAHVSAVSLTTLGTAQAIRNAADRLRPGDIILLEVHRSGPASSGGSGQFGYIAIEWWPDDFAAIRYAVSKGIIVVEAAGNGGQNLDAAIYNTPAPGFPASWRNPFNPANPTSGAVVVGAGMPPSPTHGRTFQPGWGDVYADRGRCFFSNYGARVDAQGWGWEVTSTGYGDLQGGPDPNQWYTDQFSGTSSASPVVVGALACVQGVLRAHGRIPLTPARAIDLLRSSGSPQQTGPGFTFLPNMTGTGYPQVHPIRPISQRIGSRPNLRQMIAVALQNRNWIGIQFTGSVPANATRRWFTYNWPAHWHVVWTVVPTSPDPGAIQLEWKVQVERASDKYITYWVSITNLTSTPIEIEARYAVLGW
jgi:hypothetical protein